MKLNFWSGGPRHSFVDVISLLFGGVPPRYHCRCLGGQPWFKKETQWSGIFLNKRKMQMFKVNAWIMYKKEKIVQKEVLEIQGNRKLEHVQLWQFVKLGQRKVGTWGEEKLLKCSCSFGRGFGGWRQQSRWAEGRPWTGRGGRPEITANMEDATEAAACQVDGHHFFTLPLYLTHNILLSA